MCFYDGPLVRLNPAQRAVTPYCGACLVVLGWLDLVGTTLFTGCAGPDLRPREGRDLLVGTPWQQVIPLSAMTELDDWWFEKQAS